MLRPELEDVVLSFWSVVLLLDSHCADGRNRWLAGAANS